MEPHEVLHAADYDLLIGRDKRFYDLVSTIVKFAGGMDPVVVPENVLEALQELKEMSKS